MHCEQCAPTMEQVWAKVAEVIELVEGVLARVDEVLAKVEMDNRQMFADLKAQTDAGFASLQSQISAPPLPLSQDEDDEPPKLN